jgi:NitT/TauT family transport system permease protein
VVALVDPRLGAILAVWLGAWALNAVLADQGRGAGVRFFVPTPLRRNAAGAVGNGRAPLRDHPAAALGHRATFAENTSTLWADFRQTILKGALAGYVIGCGAAFLTAVAIDRSPFLQKGLLPVGNFIAALPIVGTAPILVMWFGFGWQSKAAVVVVMVFFPMLVNCVQGMKASDADAARPDAHLRGELLADALKLRLPAAMPFIFNG